MWKLLDAWVNRRQPPVPQALHSLPQCTPPPSQLMEGFQMSSDPHGCHLLSPLPRPSTSMHPLPAPARPLPRAPTPPLPTPSFLSSASHPGHRGSANPFRRASVTSRSLSVKPDLISGNHRIISFSSCRLIPTTPSPSPRPSPPTSSKVSLFSREQPTLSPGCRKRPPSSPLKRYLNMSLYLSFFLPLSLRISWCLSSLGVFLHLKVPVTLLHLSPPLSPWSVFPPTPSSSFFLPPHTPPLYWGFSCCCWLKHMVELVFSLCAFLPLRSHHAPTSPFPAPLPPFPVRTPAHSAHPYSWGLFTHLFPPPGLADSPLLQK